jgi:thiol-disulfide isomerase/thioredoxin
MKLRVDQGFRGDRVVSVQTAEAAVELRDDDGRTARLTSLTAEVKDAVAVLKIDVKHRPMLAKVVAVGSVVTAGAQPVAGARVEAAFSAGQGSAMSGVATTTDDAGAFRLILPSRGKDQKVAVVVTAAGHAGVDTQYREVPQTAPGEVDFGEIRLPPGSSISIRVVGPDGEPLAGAVVEPSGSYAERAQIARTDAGGVCTLKDLPAGVRSIHAKFGTLSASTKIPLAEGENELLVIKLQPPMTATPEPERPKFVLKAGSAAPEWEVAQWTDGQARKLADYRGKVVVLDFWGTWCGPCIRAIPAMQQLHERYAGQGVVFLGIHTAGTDVSLVKQMLARQHWDAVSGIDKGESIASGATVRAYGIEGFPSVVVIDRESKVAFNSGDIADPKRWMQEVAQLAESLKIRWPPAQDTSENDLAEMMVKLSVALYGREIERAIGNKGQ